MNGVAAAGTEGVAVGKDGNVIGTTASGGVEQTSAGGDSNGDLLAVGEDAQVGNDNARATERYETPT